MDCSKRTLSDVELRKIKPPKTGRVEIGDTVVPGLVVRVTPRGTRTFSIIYKVVGEGGLSDSGRPLAGRQHRITLGRYPIVDLKKAREEARKILETVSEGRDPRPERHEQRVLRHSNTVEAVARRFIEQDAKRTVASWQKIERCLEMHVLPTLGDRPIREVRRSDVHVLLDGLVSAGRVGTAREVRKHLSRLFNWAVDREIVDSNPLHGMERRDLIQRAEVGRSLTDDELRAIWRATGEMGYPMGSLYRMLLLTGQRRNEWAKARHSEIDMQRRQLEVPAARYKGRRDHIVPMSDATWEIYESLPQFSGEDDYLFSTTFGRVSVSGFSKGKAQLNELVGEIAPFRIHDFRVNCETRLASLGFGQDIRDAVLGHAKQGLQQTYNKHDYIEEKRDALEAYAEHLLGVAK